MKQMAQAARFQGMFWQGRHIYMLAYDPRTGQWNRTYLDLRFTYMDGRPYFVPADDQDAIRARDATPAKWRKGMPFCYRTDEEKGVKET